MGSLLKKISGIFIASVLIGSLCFASPVVRDNDNDTSVNVESDGADEDIIRFDAAGSEECTIDTNGLDCTAIEIGGSSIVDEFVNISGDTMTGDLGMADNKVTDDDGDAYITFDSEGSDSDIIKLLSPGGTSNGPYIYMDASPTFAGSFEGGINLWGGNYVGSELGMVGVDIETDVDLTQAPAVGQIYGLKNFLDTDNNGYNLGASYRLYAFYNDMDIYNPSGSVNSSAQAYGMYNYVWDTASGGAMGDVYGFYNKVDLGGAVDDDVYGIFTQVALTNTVSDVYGLFVAAAAPNATNLWGIYQNDVLATNYFAGHTIFEGGFTSEQTQGAGSDEAQMTSITMTIDDYSQNVAIGMQVNDAVMESSGSATYNIGANIESQTTGDNNTNLLLTGEEPDGSWNIYSNSTRDSYFKGGITMAEDAEITLAKGDDLVITDHADQAPFVSISGDTMTGDLNLSGAATYQLDDATVLNVIATDNLLIGDGTGAGLTTGDDNIFIGKDAGAAVAIHTNNVCIGNYSCETMTAQENVVIGYDALDATAGGRNVCVGAGACTDMASSGPSTAEGNIAIGHDAGDDVTTGAYNIFIGDDTKTDDATADHSIVIGRGAKSTSSNQLVIGKSTAGDGITNAYIGNGVAASSPDDVTVQTSGGSGTNNSGADFTLAGGISTGNATPGKLIFKTSTPGASGPSSQSLAERVSIDNDSIDVASGVTLNITDGSGLTIDNGGDITITDHADQSPFISIAGDTGTGVFDFGGATSFEIPSGTAPTVDATGEIAVSTTNIGERIVFYGASSVNVLPAKKTVCKIIENMTDEDDDLPYFSPNNASTLSEGWCYCKGTCTTEADVEFEIQEEGQATVDSVGGTVDCEDITSGDDPTSLVADNTVGSKALITFDVTNTPDPETDEYIICITYTEDE